MKEIVWDKTAKKIVRGFSVEIRKEIGALLMTLQQGVNVGPPQAKVMKLVHSSAFELRVKDSAGIYRVFYVLFDKKHIFILHAFTKKNSKNAAKRN